MVVRARCHFNPVLHRPPRSRAPPRCGAVDYSKLNIFLFNDALAARALARLARLARLGHLGRLDRAARL